MAASLKQKIRAHLDRTGQSIAGFERQAGLKINVVRNILNGLSLRPTAKTLTAIAGAMNCTVAELMNQPEDRPYAKPDTSPAIQHPALMVDTLQAILEVAQDHNRPLTIHKACLMLDEIYAYMITKNPPALDKEFVRWFVLKTG